MLLSVDTVNKAGSSKDKQKMRINIARIRGEMEWGCLEDVRL